MSKLKETSGSLFCQIDKLTQARNNISKFVDLYRGYLFFSRKNTRQLLNLKFHHLIITDTKINLTFYVGTFSLFSW